MVDNRYIMDWEIQMKENIDIIIKNELNLLIEQEKIVKGDKVYTDSQAKRELYYNSKQSEYEREYRDNYTLKLLKQCGLDIETFVITWMGVCERSSILLACVQDKIDGFFYNENGERVFNNHPLDINNVKVIYEKGVLTLEDDESHYDFYVDENQIVYVNGENVLNLVPVPTREEDNKMIRNLMNNMKTGNQEKTMHKSL